MSSPETSFENVDSLSLHDPILEVEALALVSLDKLRRTGAYAYTPTHGTIPEDGKLALVYDDSDIELAPVPSQAAIVSCTGYVDAEPTSQAAKTAAPKIVRKSIFKANNNSIPEPQPVLRPELPKVQGPKPVLKSTFKAAVPSAALKSSPMGKKIEPKAKTSELNSIKSETPRKVRATSRSVSRVKPKPEKVPLKPTRADKAFKERAVWLDQIDPEVVKKMKEKSEAKAAEASIARGTSESSAIARLTDHRILAHEEVINLAKRIERGDLIAKEKLITHNMRLVVRLSSPYSKASGIPFLDMIVEGTIGLVRAAEKFDYRRGYRFSTYATIWINQACQRAVDNTARDIRLPAHVAQKTRTFDRARKKLMQLNHTDVEPSDEMIAEYTGYDIDLIPVLRRANGLKSSSLNAPVNDSAKSATLGELLDNGDTRIEDSVTDEMQQEATLDLLDELPRRTKKILTMKFGTHGYVREKSTKELMSLLNLSRETIEREIATGLAELQRLANNIGILSAED